MIAASRSPRRAAVRSSRFCCVVFKALGSPGRATRARLIWMRNAAPCSYRRVIAARAWFTVAGLAPLRRVRGARR